MPVYTRIRCPSCAQTLHLRLEYLNRRVVCNHCQHHFLSRARVRIPPGASAELVQTITEINRVQGFAPPGTGSEEFAACAAVAELGSSSEHPRIELAASSAVEDPTRTFRVSASPPASAPRELDELLAKVQRLRGQLELSRRRAVDLARVETELEQARAECVQGREALERLQAEINRGTDENARLVRERDQACADRERAERLAAELAARVESLGADLDRLGGLHEDQRRTHARALETLRAEYESGLESARAASAAALDEARTLAQGFRVERDMARSLADEAERAAAQRAALLGEVLAVCHRLEADRLAETTRAQPAVARDVDLGDGGAGRTLAIAAERLARERNDALAQLGEARAQLDEARGRLEQTLRQLESERQGRQAELQRALAESESRIREGAEARLEEIQTRYQTDVRRLAEEAELARRQQEAEVRRTNDLSRQVERLEAELKHEREEREAESQAQGNIIEELRILLTCRQRFELSLEGAEPPDEREAEAVPDASAPPPAEDGETRPAAVPGGPAGPEAATTADATAGAADPQDDSTPAKPAPSPDARIAALRVHLKKIHAAESERLNKRLLRRLSRVWRNSEPS